MLGQDLRESHGPELRAVRGALESHRCYRALRLNGCQERIRACADIWGSEWVIRFVYIIYAGAEKSPVHEWWQ